MGAAIQESLFSAPPAGAPRWPTLSRLNISLAAGPATCPHWWSLILRAPSIESPVCAKHPKNPMSRMLLSSGTDGYGGSERSSKHLWDLNLCLRLRVTQPRSACSLSPRHGSPSFCRVCEERRIPTSCYFGKTPVYQAREDEKM